MIRFLFLSLITLGFLIPHEVVAEERFLQGRVLRVGEHDELHPEIGQDVQLVETGDTARTKAGGRFRLFLKGSFKPGTKITLAVEKPDWRIQYPLDGETRVPNDLEKEIIEIRLLPVGSKKFWTEDRLEKFIKDIAKKSREQVRPEGKPEDIDFNHYIEELAQQFGFTPQQVQSEIDQWVAKIEQKDDPYQLGLAAYAKKHFSEAGTYFETSATEKKHRAQAASQAAQQFTAEAIRDYRLAGDAHTNAYRFPQALSAYQSARDLTPTSADARLWADLTILIGNTESAIGIRTQGNTIQVHLTNAVTAYQDALTIYTREHFPQDWAATQNNLGIVLYNQGLRTPGEVGTHLLAQAVTAYQDALTVRTREHLPQDWAATQNNLGLVLSDQGVRTPGEAGTRLLAQAVTAYQDALTVRTREHLPQDWAATQNNLGIVLYNQGLRTPGEAGTHLLAQAVTAYQDALTVRTREHLPQDWAMTQNNLGIVLYNQGLRTPGEAGTRLLAQAVTAYQDALTVRTREHLPQDWAMTQNNLATTLLQLQRWQAAAEAYQQILSVYPHAEEIYLQAQTLYHEILFDFSAAFALNQQWLINNPDDLSAQANFSETHVTTGRFTEAHDRLTALLQNPHLDPAIQLALHALLLTTQLTQPQHISIRSTLDTLRNLLLTLVERNELIWSFTGTKRFINQDPQLAKVHDWLRLLFDVLEMPNGKQRLENFEKIVVNAPLTP